VVGIPRRPASQSAGSVEERFPLPPLNGPTAGGRVPLPRDCMSPSLPSRREARGFCVSESSQWGSLRAVIGAAIDRANAAKARYNRAAGTGAL
jgi:hypothetical protein